MGRKQNKPAGRSTKQKHLRREKSASPPRHGIRQRKNNVKKNIPMQETNLDTTTSLLLSEYTDDDDDSVSSGSYEDIEEEDLLRLRELERKQISVNEQEEDFWFLFFLFAVFVIGSVLIFYYIFNSGNVTNGNNNRRRWGMQERRHHQRVKDSVYHLSVTLKDLYMGVPDKKMTIERQIVCSSCNDCPDCDNHRMEKESQRDFFSGRIFHTCFCNYHVSLPVHVKKGMQHDDLIRLDGEGNRHPSAYNGDVVFQLKSSNFYGNFQRFDGIHLKTTITISLNLLSSPTKNWPINHLRIKLQCTHDVALTHVKV